ncbi:MAG: flavodoxin FldA [Candidatus Lightella neohaematopini]|nr:flavodoxin FldA [Candidatus Lightella neohaematopini]
MADIGIFFGSDTGNTENIANIIHNKLGKDNSDLFDIVNSKKNDLERYNNLIFGVPTWYYGEVQCDWDDFIPILRKINFSGKNIAIFGCGDQEDYPQYFCDAIGIIGNIVKKNNANLCGYWPTTGYNFESSKGLLNDGYFLGLALDEDRQSELSINRVNMWIRQILKEMNINFNF